jgi:hypothetical protein
MMLVEGIYDLVHQQYPGDVTAAVASPSRVAPGAASASPSSLLGAHRLEAIFTVSSNDRLAGNPESVLRSVRAARANLKARVHDPFELRFEERSDAATLIATDDSKLSDFAHRSKVKAFERRTLIAARQARWARGVELILWYGGTLFHGSEKMVEKACVVAIRNWFSVALTNSVNPGGMQEAWHEILYPAHPMAISFTGERKMTFEATPVASLPPQIIATSFAPNLIAKYLYHLEVRGEAYLTEQRDMIFDVGYWTYGPK